jgi:hypothetical protein
MTGFAIKCYIGYFAHERSEKPFDFYGGGPEDDCKTINGGKKSFQIYVKK